ncbi:hypothetical protein Salat_2900600 [Sesamum alatum]|uniref:Myb/SANT-like domain-containing protein n=1 Tax=Sesamum alatum TaxID=300844 RepID=A0AAE2C8F1_9LAMI|nr:hypothetical protein Salat_2900600 [Sesamum alatum]
MGVKKRVKAQSKFFYTRTWTKDVDQAFMNCLAWEADRGRAQSDANRPNLTALGFAQRAVNVYAHWDHGLDFYESKLGLLRKRYEAFGKLLHNPGFTWDVETNTVRATSAEWATLVGDIPFANAYRWRGEKKWGLLCTIFIGENVEDLDRERLEHNAAGDGEGDGSYGDDDDGVVFLGMKDGNEPHDVVDLVSSEGEN